MPVYNKLVRDKIPEIIDQDGKTFKTKKLNDQEFQTALMEKLTEEFEELKSTETTKHAKEELADILELIHSLSNVYNSNIDEIDQIRIAKKAKRGGFDDKIYLVNVED